MTTRRPFCCDHRQFFVPNEKSTHCQTSPSDLLPLLSMGSLLPLTGLLKRKMKMQRIHRKWRVQMTKHRMTPRTLAEN